jgi:hypothetical protein
LMEAVLFWLLLGVGAGVLQKGAATQGSHLFCVLYCPRVRESKLHGLSQGQGRIKKEAARLSDDAL